MLFKDYLESDTVMEDGCGPFTVIENFARLICLNGGNFPPDVTFTGVPDPYFLYGCEGLTKVEYEGLWFLAGIVYQFSLVEGFAIYDYLIEAVIEEWETQLLLEANADKEEEAEAIAVGP